MALKSILEGKKKVLQAKEFFTRKKEIKPFFGIFIMGAATQSVFP